MSQMTASSDLASTATLPDFPSLSTAQAFQFYESIRNRLPQADFTGITPRHVPDLGALTDLFDVFVFDAYGVLNRGMAGVPGASARIKALVAAGKSCFVLTNGASQTLADNVAKFERLDMPFPSANIISSRMASERALERYDPELHWGVVAGFPVAEDALPVHFMRLLSDPALYDRVDAFLFLSAIGYEEPQFQMLRDSLAAHPRPLMVANPDVVAPQEGFFSLEPGFFSHRLADQLGLQPEFHGKPFGSVFDIVTERVGGIAPERIAMMGDTLHTDVLGAAAVGWKSVLVTDYGLFAGEDPQGFITESGIVPDYIVPHI